MKYIKTIIALLVDLIITHKRRKKSRPYPPPEKPDDFCPDCGQKTDDYDLHCPCCGLKFYD